MLLKVKRSHLRPNECRVISLGRTATDRRPALESPSRGWWSPGLTRHPASERASFRLPSFEQTNLPHPPLEARGARVVAELFSASSISPSASALSTLPPARPCSRRTRSRSAAISRGTMTRSADRAPAAGPGVASPWGWCRCCSSVCRRRASGPSRAPPRTSPPSRGRRSDGRSRPSSGGEGRRHPGTGPLRSRSAATLTLLCGCSDKSVFDHTRESLCVQPCS